MKGVRLHEHGGPEVLKIEEVERPAPGEGEILIQVRTAGINYADIISRRGQMGPGQDGPPQGPPPGMRPPDGVPTEVPMFGGPPPEMLEMVRNIGAYIEQPFPITLGFEVAGTIAEVGSGVTGLTKGTRVVALLESDGYAEYAVASAEQVWSLPDNVSFEQAVAVPVQGLTVYLLLKQMAHLRRGESVLVHAAAGGTGSLASQLVKLLGAGLVIGSTTSPEKADYIRSLGVDLVINTKHQDWVQQVKQATNGRGVNIVLDSVGGSVTNNSLLAMAKYGRLFTYGGTGGLNQLVTLMLIPNCLSVGGFNPLITDLEDRRKAGHELLEFISSGQLRITEGLSFPLAQAAQAHTALENRLVRGKAILTI